MKTELKTAIVLGVVVAVGIVGINVYFGSVEEANLSVYLDMDVPILNQSLSRPAPDIVGIADYINTTPEDLQSRIEGNVVMYDIWTYSCINCIRTLPFITAWDEKYADQGLLIIGIHSPEFEFEKDANNVQQAVDKYNIQYPVVLDNDRDTWNAFENRYWPRKYIADHEGFIRYDHIGEGSYEETEEVIQVLLAQRAEALNMAIMPVQSLVEIEQFDHTRGRTPELYLGYGLAFGRNNLGNPEGFVRNTDVSYSIPDSKSVGLFYMDGTWHNGREGMTLISESGGIELIYQAKEVNIVAAGSGTIEVFLDGEPIAAEYRGSDVDGNTIRISESDLYNVVTSETAGQHELWLRTDSPGLEIFTFTFG